MATIEREEKCTKCTWKGRRLVESIKPQSEWEDMTSLLAVGLQSAKCPKCGGDTIPITKQLTS